MYIEVFKNKLKQLMYKYGKDTEKVVIDEMSSAEATSISFDRSDLLYALHNATLHVKAMKDESNKWILKVEIKDTYDFTDFKSINEYIMNE